MHKSYMYDNHQFIFYISDDNIEYVKIDNICHFDIELKKNKLLSYDTDTYYLSHYNEDNNTLDKYIILYDKINNNIIIHRRK